MGNLSEPQLLASSTPVEFKFSARQAISIQIWFFTDVEGIVPLAAGSGTATLTVTRQTSGWSGPDSQSKTSGDLALPVSNIAGGIMPLVPGGELQGVAFGGGANSCIVTATSVVNGGAVSYRLHYDGAVRS